MLRFAVAVMAVGMVCACTPPGDEASEGLPRLSQSDGPAGAEKAIKEGAKIYTEHCAACHGSQAMGDGDLAASLPSGAPDLTGLAAANNGAFPVQHVMATVHGYPGKLHRGSMPEFTRALSGPKVDWLSPSGDVIATPKALLDLVGYLESLQKG